MARNSHYFGVENTSAHNLKVEFIHSMRQTNILLPSSLTPTNSISTSVRFTFQPCENLHKITMNAILKQLKINATFNNITFYINLKKKKPIIDHIVLEVTWKIIHFSFTSIFKNIKNSNAKYYT